MDKKKILKWVAAHMPVEVDGKRYFLHAAALLNPTEQFIWVFDKDPYAQEDINSLEPIVIKPVENEKLKILL